MVTERMQYCCFCGTELGVFLAYKGDRDTCGKVECERWARDDAQADREQAHMDLDDQMGWGRF